MANSDNALTTLTSDTGKPFRIFAIDLAEMNGPGAITVSFVGTKRSGKIVHKTFKLDGKVGFQRFAFPETFENLIALTWKQGDNLTNGIHMFDNVHVAPMAK